jgi:hypothetical protein
MDREEMFQRVVEEIRSNYERDVRRLEEMLVRDREERVRERETLKKKESFHERGVRGRRRRTGLIERRTHCLKLSQIEVGHVEMIRT